MRLSGPPHVRIAMAAILLAVVPLDAGAFQVRASHQSASKNFSKYPVPQLTVDLDAPPEERWKGVILHYHNTGTLGVMARNGHRSHKAANTKLTSEDRDAWAEVAKAQLDEDMRREIHGTIDYANSLLPAEDNITFDSIVLSSLMYEENYPTYCSGLVAAMPDGTVVHGRNMDYTTDGAQYDFTDVTVDVVFVRGGKPLLTSVTWPFQFGVHTAMRFGGWTFEQNTRRLGDDMRMNLAAGQRGAHAFGWKVRRVMEHVPDFETAVAELYSLSFIAPQYFIMTGARPWEGAVLTIDREGQHLPESPPLQRLSQGAGGQATWLLLQTNDDANKEPLDLRRPLEQLKLVDSKTNDVSPEWIVHQMTEDPLHNEMTAFSWVAVPGTGYHETVLPHKPIDFNALLIESHQKNATSASSSPSASFVSVHDRRHRFRR